MTEARKSLGDAKGAEQVEGYQAAVVQRIGTDPKFRDAMAEIAIKDPSASLRKAARSLLRRTLRLTGKVLLAPIDLNETKINELLTGDRPGLAQAWLRRVPSETLARVPYDIALQNLFPLIKREASSELAWAVALKIADAHGKTLSFLRAATQDRHPDYLIPAPLALQVRASTELLASPAFDKTDEGRIRSVEHSVKYEAKAGELWPLLVDRFNAAIALRRAPPPAGCAPLEGL